MKKIVLLSFVLISVLSCGVKKAEPVAAQPAAQIGARDLPPGVTYTANKRFLIKPSVEQIQVGNENEEYGFRIEYSISTAELSPINENFNVEVKYGMPSMPLMKIRPAVVSYPASGKIYILYSIDMAQDWRMELKISKKDGTLEDTITYDYYIPE